MAVEQASGGRRSCGNRQVAVASFIETCKLNGVNPHAWLTDTLTRLVNGWPASTIDELLPWAYANAPPDPATWGRGSAYGEAVR